MSEGNRESTLSSPISDRTLSGARSAVGDSEKCVGNLAAKYSDVRR